MSQIGQLINPTGSNIQTLTGDSGGAVGPDGAGNINVFGGDTVTVTGNPGTNTLTWETTASGYPITPFVVGPAGEAGYQTVQAGIDAANSAGGGMVYVQPGTWTEDLTLYDNVGLWGAGCDATIIAGTHAPPASGAIYFFRIAFTDAASIFSSVAAGTTTITLEECCSSVTAGYTFDLASWTGEVIARNVDCSGGTTDGFINNTGGADVTIFSGVIGAGTLNSLSTSATFFADHTYLSCPIDFVTGAIGSIYNSSVLEPLTFSNDSTGSIQQTYITGGASAAVTMSSSAAWTLSDVTVLSTNNPSIAGSGAGSLALNGITFVSDSNIAGTLTVTSDNFYSGTLKTDYTDHGVILGQGATSDMVATAVGTDGQVLIGATGADPAFATITSSGGTITFTPGANTLNMEAGGGVPTQFDTDSGSAVPAVNVLDVLGGTLINTAGATNVVTINADDAVAASFPTDSGTATPSGNALTIAGANGITTSGSSATVTITGSGSSIHTWVEETGTTADFVAGQGIIANNGAGITCTLPASAAQGTVIRIAGVGAGGWTIDQGTGQSINYLGTSTTTTTGTLAGDEVNACLELLCIVADTTWLALSSTGNFTIT